MSKISATEAYWMSRTKQYAYSLYRLISDGDGDAEELYNMMVKDHFVNVHQEWIDE